jgi:cytochrome c556
MAARVRHSTGSGELVFSRGWQRELFTCRLVKRGWAWRKDAAVNKHRLLTFGVACCIALPAAAQFRKPEDAIKYRQSAMFLMGNHLYTRIGGMVNGRAPYDPKAAADSAELVATLSKVPFPAFLPGTDKGDTDAQPAVWTEQARFKDLSEKMQAEVVKLAAVAKTGDLDALKAAYRAATSSCKSCHDHFTTQ